MRRLFTRCLGLIPSLIVAAASGRSGIDTLLVASQVILSIVLPFIVLPLVWLTSSRAIMSVKKPNKTRPVSTASDAQTEPVSEAASTFESASEAREKARVERREQARGADGSVDGAGAEAQAEETIVDFSNGWVVMLLGYAIWLVVVIANVYAIVGLCLGLD